MIDSEAGTVDFGIDISFNILNIASLSCTLMYVFDINVGKRNPHTQTHINTKYVKVIALVCKTCEVQIHLR